MENYFSSSKFFYYYLGTFIFWTIIFIGIRIFSKKGKKEINLLNSFLIALGFSFLGLTIGIILGLSKSPLGEVIISTIFTLIGGVSIYLFAGKDNQFFQKENQRHVSMLLIGISLFLVVGMENATMERVRAESLIKQQDLTIKKEMERYKMELREYEIKQDIFKAKETQQRDKD